MFPGTFSQFLICVGGMFRKVLSCSEEMPNLYPVSMTQIALSRSPLTPSNSLHSHTLHTTTNNSLHCTAPSHILHATTNNALHPATATINFLQQPGNKNHPPPFATRCHQPSLPMLGDTSL
jgi:hypothetical protein